MTIPLSRYCPTSRGAKRGMTECLPQSSLAESIAAAAALNNWPPHPPRHPCKSGAQGYRQALGHVALDFPLSGL